MKRSDDDSQKSEFYPRGSNPSKAAPEIEAVVTVRPIARPHWGDTFSTPDDLRAKYGNYVDHKKFVEREMVDFADARELAGDARGWLAIGNEWVHGRTVGRFADFPADIFSYIASTFTLLADKKYNLYVPGIMKLATEYGLSRSGTPEQLHRSPDTAEKYRSLSLAQGDLERLVAAAGECSSEPKPNVASEPSLSNRETLIVETIRRVGHRLTTLKVLEAMTEGIITGESATKAALASLCRHGILTNIQSVDPPGYGLPEWD
jgi:hypothetical protein